jgi:hypothetical protein
MRTTLRFIAKFITSPFVAVLFIVSVFASLMMFAYRGRWVNPITELRKVLYTL